MNRSVRQAAAALTLGLALALAACGGDAADGAGQRPAAPTAAAAPRPIAAPRATAAATAAAAPTSTARPTAAPAPRVEPERPALTPAPAATTEPVAPTEPAPTPTPEAAPAAARLTLLLLGVDQAESFQGNTDVIMLMSIDAASKSVFVLSVPRDLCLGPCDGHGSRINEVLRRQDIEALKQTIRNVTGLHVDFWMLVNFHGVEAIINRLGGIRVWSNREFDERFVYLDTEEEIRLILEEGWNTLNGREAVAYGRSRKYDAADDFARICRQQQVVRALHDQALSPALLVNAPGVLASLDGAFKTDVPFGSVPALGQLLLSIPQDRINSWAVHSRGHDLLTPLQAPDGAALYRPDIHAIRDFVQDALLASTEAHADQEGNPTFVRDNCEEYFP